MKVIILLLLLSLAVAVFFLFAFIWGVQDGQFDDDYAPPRRILFDSKDINHID
ncbi:MAG TPA: cbb3-type cytochrome oxidase assembly protein CcoS [Saprospiraceae bacterium]|nr:cbb3-type cytochrome oxidase assembly protein CcoS [Saprospiraceae bacterium]